MSPRQSLHSGLGWAAVTVRWHVEHRRRRRRRIPLHEVRPKVRWLEVVVVKAAARAARARLALAPLRLTDQGPDGARVVNSSRGGVVELLYTTTSSYTISHRWGK